MSQVRRPVAAGSFYPAEAERLAAEVDRLLGTAEETRSRPLPPADAIRGLVVPHAGYEYSGPIAASAYALLAQLEPPPPVVIILGPSHFEPLDGLAVAPHDAWRTPLGEASIDGPARDAFLTAGATSREEPHRAEHSIEVQLPFLQRCHPGVPILPVAVGIGPPRRGAEILDAALPTHAFVALSTDLSHYHDAETARRIDARTAAAIEGLAVDSLGPADACGVDALRVGMAWASRRGFRIDRLDLRNSADTAGDPLRVVGYGAFAIVDEPA